MWEVAAQLLGLASSVSLLHAIEAGGRPEAVLWVWALVQVTPSPLWLCCETGDWI